MVTQGTFQSIVSLAQKSFQHHLSPELFATKAAILVTEELASEKNQDLGVVIAYIASMSLLKSSKISLILAASAIHEQARLQAHSAIHLDKKINAGAWESFVDQLNDKDVCDNAFALATKGLSEQEAGQFHSELERLSKNFIKVYFFCYAAFLHGVIVSAPFDDKQTVFNETLASRLSSDLLVTPIDSGLFINIMSSPLTQYMAIALLIIGITALAASCTPLIAATGLSPSLFLATGVASSATSSALFVGHFFSERHKQHNKALMQETADSFIPYQHSKIDEQETTSDIEFIAH